MKSSDIRLIINKLIEINKSTQKKLDESLEKRKYFKHRATVEGEDYKIGISVTLGELLCELEELIDSYKKEIEENNDLIAKLEKELEESLICKA